MTELELKYGCNPNQKPSRIYMNDGRELPIKVLCGRPGYINFLDAFNSWQLVKEIKEALGEPCAASFKHVSPTAAAIGKKLSDKLKKSCFVDDIEGLDRCKCRFCLLQRLSRCRVRPRRSAHAAGPELCSCRQRIHAGG